MPISLFYSLKRTLPVVIVGGGLFNGCAAPAKTTTKAPLASKPIQQTKPLVTGVKTKELFKALNIAPLSEGTAFSPVGVTYRLQGKEGARSLSLGIFASGAKAKAAFGQVRLSAMGHVQPPKGLGDEFAGFGTASQYGLRFRRNNVIISFRWDGKLADAIAFGRRIEHYIQNPVGIFTTGETLDTPRVEISSPKVVDVGNDLVIRYRTAAKNKVAALSSVSLSPWGQAGEFRFTPRKLGPQTQTLTFIDSNHLVFERVVAYDVIRQS